MQSTEHDSHDAAAAEYATARKIIQGDVAEAAAHGGIESVIVAVDEATGLLDRTPWTMWDEMGCLVLTLFPANARQSLDTWSTALARWVDTHAEVERIRTENEAMGWSTIVVNPGEVLDIVRADAAAGLPGALEHVIPADAGHRVGPCGWDTLADDVDARAEEVADAVRRSTRRRRIILGAAAVAAAAWVAVAGRAGAAELSPAYESAPGHGPSISVECDGAGGTTVAVHPWDEVGRNWQVWSGPRLLVNVNEARHSSTHPAGTVTHVVYAGHRFAVADTDCAARPTTTTTTPTTTSTTATPPTLPPVTVTTQPPATTVPPATSTSVSPSTTAVVPPNDPNTPLDPPPPVSTTWATTPPPADVPPATAVVPPPVSATPPALTGGELPRTGGNPWALILFGGAMVAAGAGIVANARTNRKES